jgi:hypothetical protein
MKTKIILLLAALAACRASSQVIDPYGSMNAALPLQAATCDIAGIASLVEQGRTNATVNVSQYWVGGGSGTNLVTMYKNEDAAFPGGGTNFVFFVSTYLPFLRLHPSDRHFYYIFDMDYNRSLYQPDGSYLWNGDDRSWFPVVPDNAAMVTWCSNLVYVSQVNTNMQAFYELIRDGYKNYPETSRIHRDSKYAFQHAGYYMPTNFMASVWTDTNLVGWARAWLNSEYQQETGSFLQ